MWPFVPVVLALASCSAAAAAAEPVIEIQLCATPLWLELSNDATGQRYTLRACGTGGVDAEPEDDAFRAQFPNFELRHSDEGWSVAWSANPEQLGDLRQAPLQIDRKPVRLKVTDDDAAPGGFQASLWPRHAPHDVQINVDAPADQILRELVRVTGVQIDGIELQQPTTTRARSVSVDRSGLIDYLVTSAWLLQLGPNHYRLGKARAESTRQMNREDFLRAVTPQTANDFPQPAIDVHAELAFKARSEGRDDAAIEHIRAALALLEPWSTGEAELQRQLRIELAELLAAAGGLESAQAAVPTMDVNLHAPALVLRALAVQLRGPNAVDVTAGLKLITARLDALPSSATHAQRLLLLSVRSAAKIAASELGPALPLQTKAIEGWRTLPFEQANDLEPGPQIRRQLLLNEAAMIAILSDAGHTELVDARIAVAEWLQQLSGNETPSATLQRYKEKVDRTK